MHHVPCVVQQSPVFVDIRHQPFNKVPKPYFFTHTIYSSITAHSFNSGRHSVRR